MNKLKHAFEKLLWSSRLIMLGGAIFSAMMALGAFYMATMDAFMLPGLLLDYSNLELEEEQHSKLRAKVITMIVKSLDGYVITAILIIFALGLYEFFVGKMEAARESPLAPYLLHFGGLNELKERIAKLLVLVLVIEFFQRALFLAFDTPLDLVYLAVGIVLISLTLLLSKLGPHGKNEEH